ncbi:MAG TPA: hypothetical protein VKT82_15610 [Ktedonobacterales bacterium]|nr:hypothetical protein [Ktedonobacterales bacterium]
MRNNTITRSRPVPTGVGPSQGADSLPKPARKHTFLGTAFLAEKAQKWGHRRLIVLIVAFFGVPLLAVCLLLAAGAPFIAYFFTAPANYQPTVLVQTDFFGAPGETDTQGIKHPTTLILTYTDHLTVTELPAGDAKRASTISTPFVQHPTNPQIVSAVQADLGRKTKDLVVKVSMNWQSLSPETFVFDFTSHPEQMSATPGTPGYTAPEYGLYTVTQGG